MQDVHNSRPRTAFDRNELLRALRAFASGDLSVRMPAGLSGIDGELAEAFNDIVKVSQAMTAEFARIRVVAGVEGNADQRAQVPAAGGAWAACIESLNLLIGDLRKAGGQENPADIGGFRRRATDSVAELEAHQAQAKIREENLHRINRQLRENAVQLSGQMKQIGDKNREVELAKAALEEKAEQLTLSSRYKSEFVANMSHELRTPLNSLLILAQMLAENPAGNLLPKQVEYAQTIHAAGNDLLTLINDLLDLAKIESGTVTLNVATERFAHLRDYLDRTFRQVGNDKGLQFAISLDQDLPATIRTDANRLRQILKNLLANAFKFTPKGAVSIEVTVATAGWTAGHPLDAARKVAAFSVIDTGIGIPADKQQMIFEEFQQADGTTSRHFGGTGLGLSISSKLAHLLGGEITVRSAPGEGSRFTLYLPFAPDRVEGGDIRNAGAAPGLALIAPAEALRYYAGADAPAGQRGLPKPAGKSMPELAGRKVLIVDDDIRSIFALTIALEQHAMVVMNAESGATAIGLLKIDPQIDVILLDMMMPGLDGYRTIRLMRSLEGCKDVPIIGVSARAMARDRDKALEAGASDYISKPLDVDKLLSLIRAWVLKKSGT